MSMTPVCSYCQRFHAQDMTKNACDAFPNGIPDVIISGENNHVTPVDGDHGLLFLPSPGFEYKAVPAEKKKPTKKGQIVV